ncbi:hypothetical protein SAMN05660742_10797 [Propionispira arboris]|uniref:Uncharacterized protein n=1 Tax=Propionispira arboris TaxID=84035 RepID=A0A1H6YN15_9FIRM|nr:hypothetical protein [Propionispira arboris]SEJ42669.1 hypothetical protein SAMN05660742_10797 [Propionispira arboris]
MQVFEMATQELLLKHEEGNLKNLEDISADYYWAQKAINQLEKELEANLPQETMTKIRESWYKLGLQESIAEDIFYDQGFSDGVRMLLESLTWGPVRR